MGAALGVVLALALLLPAAGPPLDHHFFERLPTHTHLYLKGLPEYHEHAAFAPHTHDDGNAGRPLGLVVLPDPESMLLLLGLPALALAALLSLLPVPSLLTVLLARFSSRQEQTSPGPPVPPPRIALLSS